MKNKVPKKIVVRTHVRKFNASKLPPRNKKGQWKPKARQAVLFK